MRFVTYNKMCEVCDENSVVKNGFFILKSGVKIQKLKCMNCGVNSSKSNVNNDHIADIKNSIIDQITLNISQRNIAINLGCSRTTIQNKIKKYNLKKRKND